METAAGVQPPGMLSDTEGMESSVPRKIRVKDRRGMSLILDSANGAEVQVRLPRISHAIALKLGVEQEVRRAYHKGICRRFPWCASAIWMRNGSRYGERPEELRCDSSRA